MKLINLEKAINYGKEKDYIKTAGQEEAVREVFALATVEAVPIDVLDKIRAEIMELDYIDEDKYEGTSIDPQISRDDVLEIIDKHKAESEG